MNPFYFNPCPIHYIWLLHMDNSNYYMYYCTMQLNKKYFSSRVWTLSFSTIPHFLWFRWWSNHSLIHKELKDFVLFVLWDPCPPTQSCIDIYFLFLIDVANNSNKVITSLFDESFIKLIKYCSRSGFFRLARCFRNSIACLNIAQW